MPTACSVGIRTWFDRYVGNKGVGGTEGLGDGAVGNGATCYQRFEFEFSEPMTKNKPCVLFCFVLFVLKC